VCAEWWPRCCVCVCVLFCVRDCDMINVLLQYFTLFPLPAFAAHYGNATDAIPFAPYTNVMAWQLAAAAAAAVVVRGARLTTTPAHSATAVLAAAVASDATAAACAPRGRSVHPSPLRTSHTRCTI